MVKGFLKKFFLEHEISIVFGFLLLMLLTGTIFYHSVEDLKWVDSIYFSVTTLATIGFGDISPKTDIGKIFTVFYAIIGIGTFLTFVNMIAKTGLDAAHKQRKNIRERVISKNSDKK